MGSIEEPPATDGSRHTTTNGFHDPTDAYYGAPKRYSSNGLSVLVVGGGPGGLLTALECWRKGCDVRLVDRASGPINTGDVFSILPSAMSIFRHWPQLWTEVEAEQYDSVVSYWHHDGSNIYGPASCQFNDPEEQVGRIGPHVGFMQNRRRFFFMLLRQIDRCKIPITWGKKVTEYFEDIERGIGGVCFDDGERWEADVVVAADGIRTASGRLIAGYTVEPQDSGQSIYRSGYDGIHVRDNKEVQMRWPPKAPNEQPEWQFWLGRGLHLSVMVSDDFVVWGVTHKDEYAPDGVESWQASKVEPEEVVKLIDKAATGWHPAVKALIHTTPKNGIVHWKLRWRDLNREWASPGGRIIQVGDSCHSFLPASGNGATQALEDATSLATCLQLAGKSNAHIATKVHNRLRYERVSCAQLMSFLNTQQHHFADWSKIAANPKLVRTKFPRWITKHDPEAYAIEKFGQGFMDVISDGAIPLVNTNFPPGHTHKPWKVEDMRYDLKHDINIRAKLDGDWS